MSSKAKATPKVKLPTVRKLQLEELGSPTPNDAPDSVVTPTSAAKNKKKPETPSKIRYIRVATTTGKEGEVKHKFAVAFYTSFLLEKGKTLTADAASQTEDGNDVRNGMEQFPKMMEKAEIILSQLDDASVKVGAICQPVTPETGDKPDRKDIQFYLMCFMFLIWCSWVIY